MRLIDSTPRAWLQQLVLLALCTLSAIACACTSTESSSPTPTSVGHGPLAVIDGLGGNDASGGTGPVTIDGDCVTMVRSNGEKLLLVWHGAEVRWDDSTGTIEFSGVARPTETPILIRDGDTITVGGSGLRDEDPMDGYPLWLAPPAASCDGEMFAVSYVTVTQS